MIAHIWNLSTTKAKKQIDLWDFEVSLVYIEFQDYADRLCLKKKKEKEGKGRNQAGSTQPLSQLLNPRPVQCAWRATVSKTEKVLMKPKSYPFILQK